MQIRLHAKVYMDSKEFDGEICFNSPYLRSNDVSIHIMWQALKDMPKATMGLSLSKNELYEVLRVFEGLDERIAGERNR